jgi:hypothetical protein
LKTGCVRKVLPRCSAAGISEAMPFSNGAKSGSALLPLKSDQSARMSSRVVVSSSVMPTLAAEAWRRLKPASRAACSTAFVAAPVAMCTVSKPLSCASVAPSCFRPAASTAV